MSSRRLASDLLGSCQSALSFFIFPSSRSSANPHLTSRAQRSVSSRAQPDGFARSSPLLLVGVDAGRPAHERRPESVDVPHGGDACLYSWVQPARIVGRWGDGDGDARTTRQMDLCELFPRDADLGHAMCLLVLLFLFLLFRWSGGWTVYKGGTSAGVGTWWSCCAHEMRDWCLGAGA
jgi:hypothetical protein